MKKFTTIGLLILSLTLVGMTSTIAATVTTGGSGNWSSTTPNAPWPGGTIPGTGDDIVIGAGFTLTVDGDRTCNSMTVGNGSTLTVNSTFTLTVTAAITFPNIAATNVTGTIGGAGSITAASLGVGNNTGAGSSNGTFTHNLTSTISSLTLSGNLTITSTIGTNSGRIGNGVFTLSSGTVTVNGSVTTVNADAVNTSTLTLAAGAQTGSLVLGGATPFAISGTGTSTITLNGTSATVNYNRAGIQTVRGTTYTNLTLAGSGDKTISTSTTVNGTLSMRGTAAAITNAVAFGASGILEYRGGAAQTSTSIEFPSSSGPATLKINNASGVTLHAARTVTTLTIGDATSNSVFSDGGFQVTSSGTLNLTSGTFNRLLKNSV